MNAAHFTRKRRHLVVLPDAPKWFVIDDFALNLLRKIFIEELPIEAVLAGTKDEDREELLATIESLRNLVTCEKDETEPITHTLTAKTTVAMIAVTNRCNLTCPHCYVDANTGSTRQMSLDEHRRLAREIIGSLTNGVNGRFGIALTGGEPFAHRQITDIIRIYRESGLGVGISSNGLLIKAAQIQFLREQGVVMSISLDGCSPTTHESIRGCGTFKKTVNRIRLLTENSIKVGVNFLLHEGNACELEETIALVHALGCSGFNPMNLVQLGRACASPLRRVSETRIYARIARHLVRYPEHRHLFLKTSMFSSLGAALLAGVSCSSCGVGNRPCVYVNANGDVFACANTQRAEFRLGNIRTQSLKECVREDHQVLSMFRNLNVDNLNPACSTCDVRKFCGGDCRGETYNVTGDIRAPYVGCRDRRRSLIELMWIASQHPEIFRERADEYAEYADRGV